MDHADLVVATVGVAVLGAATGGILLGGEGLGATTFGITWQRETQTLEATGRITEEQIYDTNLNLTAENLTTVRIEITLQAPGPRASEKVVTATVTPPDAPAIQKQARLPVGGAITQRIPFDFTLASVPTTLSVTAPTQSEARAALQAFATSVGRGPWHVVVESRSGDVALPADLEVVHFRIAMETDRYFAIVEPAVRG